MKQTKNLQEIEKWIKERNGLPSIVKDTPDLLRIKFDNTEDSLEEITWAKFFKAFKDNDLVFIYEEDISSRFCKFVYEHENNN